MQKNYVVQRPINFTPKEFKLHTGDILRFDQSNRNNLTVYRSNAIVMTTHLDTPNPIAAMVSNKVIKDEELLAREAAEQAEQAVITATKALEDAKQAAALAEAQLETARAAAGQFSSEAAPEEKSEQPAPPVETPEPETKPEPETTVPDASQDSAADVDAEGDEIHYDEDEADDESPTAEAPTEGTGAPKGPNFNQMSNKQLAEYAKKFFPHLDMPKTKSAVIRTLIEASANAANTPAT
jgi:hypothetical protein